MKIVQAPNDVLSTVAQPVGEIDKLVKKVLKQMELALLGARDPEGVGLAAPQIGVSLQIFITKPEVDSQIHTFINPVIEEYLDIEKKSKTVSQSAKTAKAKKKAKIEKGLPAGRQGVQLEGCLSLNTIWGVVKRHPAVVLSYQDEQGAKHKKTFEGFMSTIIQHEVDHLNGTLFPKRVLEQGEKLYKSFKNKDGETEFEEMEI